MQDMGNCCRSNSGKSTNMICNLYLHSYWNYPKTWKLDKISVPPIGTTNSISVVEKDDLFFHAAVLKHYYSPTANPCKINAWKMTCHFGMAYFPGVFPVSFREDPKNIPMALNLLICQKLWQKTRESHPKFSDNSGWFLEFKTIVSNNASYSSVFQIPPELRRFR